MFASFWVSSKWTNKKIPGAAIAILAGLVLAYIGGEVTHGEKGIADIKIFSGFAQMGGSMFRDFTIVATAMGASFVLMKQTGWLGIVSLLLGIALAFASGVAIALAAGYSDAKSLTTIGAGACTFIVGPVTGSAIGASSDVIALSIAAGVVKSVFVTIGTPAVARCLRRQPVHALPRVARAALSDRAADAFRRRSGRRDPDRRATDWRVRDARPPGLSDRGPPSGDRRRQQPPIRTLATYPPGRGRRRGAGRRGQPDHRS